MSQPPQPPPSGSKPIQRLKTIKPNQPGEINNIPQQTSNNNSSGGGAPGGIKVKKEFKPNIVGRKKNDNKDPLVSGPITDLINASLTPLSVGDRPKVSQASAKFRPSLNPNRKKPAAIPISNLFTTPLVQANTQASTSSYEINKKKEKKDSEFLAQLFHEMEVDPMQPFHPTHLPLVDPRKIMKAYSLDDATKDLDERKKELEEKIANGELSDTSNFDLNAASNSNEINGIGGGAAGKKKKESQHFKAKPFYIDDQFQDKDKLFFIQLPNSLPSTKTRPNFNIPLPQPPILKQPPIQPSQSQSQSQSSQSQSSQSQSQSSQSQPQPMNIDSQENITPPTPPPLDDKSFIPMVYPGDFPNTLKELPSGQLGTLKIYKSGKTILIMGGVKYDISAGDKIKFLEEVNCFSKEGPTCYTLGTPVQHLVAAPIISDNLI